MSYFFPLLAALLWGANTIVTKMAAGVILPSEISFLRWLIAVIILTPIVIKPLYQHGKEVRQNLLKLITLGLLSSVIFQGLAYNAAAYTSAMHMGIIQAMMPLMAIILASIVFRDMPGSGTVAGALVSLAGVVLVISGGDLSRLMAQGINTGDGMMLVAAFAMAIYNILLKRWHMHIPLILSLYVQAFTAAVVLLPFYLAGGKSTLTVVSGSMVIYAAVGASILAPLSWMVGSKLLGPSRVSLFFNLIPVFTAVMAVIFLQEKLSWPLIAGGIMALSGVVIVEASRKRALPVTE
ncbi:DMT family transporter [Enterobacteriaceae bacterium BIT-l23]|uniref:DMT family transporter n=1 Tax=Jejubacter sp. L23 TaxID=3092086 RepID=UPI0015854C37|nr:DMT family transporter [Enterobacteriaceae bacterium BIT-l23]